MARGVRPSIRDAEATDSVQLAVQRSVLRPLHRRLALIEVIKVV
jgi:hypothetical protein